jgi:hypothetical protein
LDKEVIFINYFNSPEFKMKGVVDLGKDELSINIETNSEARYPSLEGLIKAKVSVWGKIPNVLASGYFVIEEGMYQGTEFSRAYFNFLGRPPLLYLTDAEIVLKDGSIYKIEGVMDVSNMGNLFPGAEFVSRKISVDGWELLSENKESVGLKKNVDNKFDILFNTDAKDGSSMDTATELRYNIKSDKFLRLRIQEDETIFGFERRREF